MYKSQRLEGLKLLHLIGAPVPNWQLVEDEEDISKLVITSKKYGWTIRSCWKDGKREMGLFNANNICSNDVIHKLRQIFKINDNNIFYIVYPSWDFCFSCNVILQENIYIIEGMYGSQKEISIGKGLPDFGLNIPFGLRSHMIQYIGNMNSEVSYWLGKIIWWSKRIPLETYYFEVALKSDKILIFYDLFNLKLNQY